MLSRLKYELEEHETNKFTSSQVVTSARALINV